MKSQRVAVAMFIIKCSVFLGEKALTIFFCPLQYVSLSKRLVPEAVNFLCGILFMASKKEGLTRKYIRLLHVFKVILNEQSEIMA